MKNTRKRRLMSATAAAMVALMPVTLAPASTAQPAAEAPAPVVETVAQDDDSYYTQIIDMLNKRR